MNTDRELLEMAAMAYGERIAWDADRGCFAREVKFRQYFNYEEWNPLTDDGDALRLAVKLRLDILSSTGGAEVCFCPGTSDDPFGQSLATEFDADLCAATRRAIVRAAAEIGRAMK